VVAIAFKVRGSPRPVNVCASTPVYAAEFEIESPRLIVMSAKSGSEKSNGRPFKNGSSAISLPGSAYGNGSSTTACKILNTAAFAPIASASVATTTAVNDGVLRSARSA